MHKAKHYCVSAKNGSNIGKVFIELGESIYLTNKKSDEVMVGSKRIPRLMVDDSKQKEGKKKEKKPCC